MRDGSALIDLSSLLPTRYAAFGKPLERLLGVDGINRVYAQVKAGGDDRPFFAACLAELGVEVVIGECDRERLASGGPVVVVCNHPFGVIDALAISCELASQRRDLRILGNYLLGHIPEMRPYLIDVDPFGALPLQTTQPEADAGRVDSPSGRRLSFDFPCGRSRPLPPALCGCRRPALE